MFIHLFNLNSLHKNFILHSCDYENSLNILTNINVSVKNNMKCPCLFLFGICNKILVESDLSVKLFVLLFAAGVGNRQILAYVSLI